MEENGRIACMITIAVSYIFTPHWTINHQHTHDTMHAWNLLARPYMHAQMHGGAAV